MKILKIIMPLLTIALLCSFAFSKMNNKTQYKASEKIEYKKPLNKKLPIDPVYAKFIEKFDKVNLPYAIKFDKPRFFNEDNFKKKYGTQNVSDFLGSSFAVILPEIKEGMMSRMGPDDFMAEALIKSGERYDVVVYSRSASFGGYKKFYAATFHKSGKLISKILIAQHSYEDITDFSISKNLEIKVKRTKYQENNYEENVKTSITYFQPIVHNYIINDKGEFEIQNNPSSKDLSVHYAKK